MTNTKTLLEILQSTTAYFTKHKIESPRLNAEHLIAHVLKMSRLQLYLEFETKLNEQELSQLRDLVRRRGQGGPLQHLLGTVEFCGQTFLCDKRAMVPRPETEQLVELITDCGLRMESPAAPSPALRADSKIADVGTGSGVIALSLAGKFPDAKIIGTDVSEEALALATENASRLGLADRVRFVKTNLLDGLDERFDVIVANLPYIAMADRNSLSREVLHDPEIALFGGEKGDELVRRLIEQAPERLAPGGLLALEVGLGQSGPLLELFAQKKYEDIEPKNDY